MSDRPEQPQQPPGAEERYREAHREHAVARLEGSAAPVPNPEDSSTVCFILLHILD